LAFKTNLFHLESGQCLGVVGEGFTEKGKLSDSKRKNMKNKHELI